MTTLKTITLTTPESDEALDAMWEKLEARGDVDPSDIQVGSSNRVTVFAIVSDGFDVEAEIEAVAEKLDLNVTVFDVESGWEA